MEQRTYEDSEQTVLDCKRPNILPGFEKSSALSPASVQTLDIVGSQHLETKIVSVTPDKTNKLSHIKCNSEAAELPEKYRTISEVFYRMTCSVRLLSLCKKSPTFQNICRQVNIMTGRTFSYRHLAQIKFILPEAVLTDKILVHDEKTMFMKPDMKITLLLDVVEGHHEQSTYAALRLFFASRLFNFFTAHPEGCDIPEAVLPEPFNQRSITTSPDSLTVGSSTVSLSNLNDGELLNCSHLNPSFSRHFSQKAAVAEIEKTQLLASPISSIKYDSMSNQDSGSGQQKTSLDSCSEHSMITNPVQMTFPPCHVSSSACDSTPMKFALEAENFMVETPAQSIQQRSVSSGDDKLKAIITHEWMASNMSVKRALDFSYLEGEESVLNSNADEMDPQSRVVLNIVPQIGKTKGTFVEDNVICSSSTLLKVEESSCCTAKDGLRTHQQMSACLSDLVATINYIFQSANCSSITKDELLHKIIMNNCDIVESREVEEQMELLEKLVPDWISKKLAPTGDLLYNIKKVSDLNSVCGRLISM